MTVETKSPSYFRFFLAGSLATSTFVLWNVGNSYRKVNRSKQKVNDALADLIREQCKGKSTNVYMHQLDMLERAKTEIESLPKCDKEKALNELNEYKSLVIAKMAHIAEANFNLPDYPSMACASKIHEHINYYHENFPDSREIGHSKYTKV